MPLLMNGINAGRLREVAGQIVQGGFDVHWVVAMNEGITVGNLLARLAPTTPLHVSVQDDQAAWMWCRSRRYKWTAALIHGAWKRLLLAARSVDVTSDGMHRYYLEKFGLRSVVVHPYVKRLPLLPEFRTHPGWVEIGHIGSVYDESDFAAFLHAARHWTEVKGWRLRVVVIGLGAQRGGVLRDCRADEIEDLPSMPESDAISRLHRCDFVYAMYPFARAASVFRQTSLPTKLSTYVQAQRPILAHTPADSSLAVFVAESALGVTAVSCDEGHVIGKLELIGRSEGPAGRFEDARERVYGRHNVQTLQSCLSG
jgi:hypothetical protein